MAPYKSAAQRGYMHAAAERGDISKKVVEEFDASSKGKKLPEHAKKTASKKSRTPFDLGGEYKNGL